MPKGRARAGVLTAFACWLVLLASGDDFNFARLALLSPLPYEDLLPLDDPNSDFTPSSQARELPTTSGHRCGCTTPVGPRLTRAVLLSPWAARTLGHPLRPCSNTPLRC
jgi:hypothetical protein